MAKVMPSPQDAARNWKNAMAASVDKMKRGIQAVDVSPTAKAANAVDRQVAGVIRAQQSGKTAAALNAVTLQDWKAAALDKGVGRVASGAANAEPKMANFMSEFLPFVAQGVQSLPERGDIETNIQRATAMMRHNAQFRRRRFN